MPGWMRGFANNQPITPMVNAVRALTLGPQAQAVLGHAAGYYVVRSLLWPVVMVNEPGDPMVKAVLAALVRVGAALTVSVKLCVALVPTPLLAVRVSG